MGKSSKTTPARRYPRCPNCGLAFKSKARLRAATLLSPGGGYLYLRHRRPFLFFLMAEAAAGSVGAGLLLSQGIDALTRGPIWLVLTALVALRALAWCHSAHLLGEFVPCREGKRAVGENAPKFAWLRFGSRATKAAA